MLLEPITATLVIVMVKCFACSNGRALQAGRANASTARSASSWVAGGCHGKRHIGDGKGEQKTATSSPGGEKRHWCVMAW
jgi:hypothetical protein